MNLSTAKSANRAKEVGIRKVLGSLRNNLVSQFLVESLLVSFVSLVLALLSAVLLLPLFNGLAEKQIPVSLLFQPFMIGCTVLLVFVVGLLAGSYPAFFLSAFRPIDVLKGKLSAGFKGSWLRNLLVVFQFAVSIILIAGTLVIYNQLRYIRSKDIGYNKDKLLTIGNIGVLNMQVTAFKNELLGISGISNATVTSYLPINGNRNSNAYFLTTAMDPKNAVIMQDWVVDEKYLSTLGIQLLSGRNFSPDFPTDSNAILINEIAAKALPTKELLNKKLYQFSDMEANKSVEKHIVGIIKNFNFNSLRDMVTPMALKLGNDGGSITVRLSSGNIPNVLAQVKNKWKALVPAEPFVYSFMDEEFNNQYRAEQKTGKIFISFAVLAIFIACLGLFGLAAYAAEQRTKEIGIRKVLGATISDITGMLSKDFLKLVLIASVIAFPVSWWAMYRWLQDFAYRVNIGWWIFFVSGMIVLFIVIFTVAFQAIKAAMANPVKSLRTE
jgi:putative ABC transport system permease protein